MTRTRPAFYHIEPERPGGRWYATLPKNLESTPLLPDAFAYEYWSSEPIFQDSNLFFATKSASEAFRNARLSGFRTIEIETRVEDDYSPQDWMGDPAPDEPKPVDLLLIDKCDLSQDFGIHGNTMLIVSHRALKVLEHNNLLYCLIEPCQELPEIPDPSKDYDAAKAWWESRSKESSIRHQELIARLLAKKADGEKND